ncbi:MAG: DUF1275 family protein [Alphaproteobacteria bacterium]
MLHGKKTPESARNTGTYFLLVVSFIAGGVVGAFLYQSIGFTFSLPLAIILLCLIFIKLQPAGQTN